MRTSPFNRNAGFTLVELLIGMSLSLVVMSAVLTSYVFLGRNFTRSLGLSAANQPTLEAQGRRALAYFVQDVRMANGLSFPGSWSQAANYTVGDLAGLSGTTYRCIAANLNQMPPNSTYWATTTAYTANASMTLNIPAGSTTTTVTYIYNSSAGTLTRTPASGIAQVLHSNLLSFNLSYYDNAGRPYTSFTNYLAGITQVSMTFSAQAGSSVNGTLTQVYRSDSSRLILRNKPLLQ